MPGVTISVQSSHGQEAGSSPGEVAQAVSRKWPHFACGRGVASVIDLQRTSPVRSTPTQAETRSTSCTRPLTSKPSRSASRPPPAPGARGGTGASHGPASPWSPCSPRGWPPVVAVTRSRHPRHPRRPAPSSAPRVTLTWAGRRAGRRSAGRPARGHHHRHRPLVLRGAGRAGRLPGVRLRLRAHPARPRVRRAGDRPRADWQRAGHPAVHGQPGPALGRDGRHHRERRRGVAAQRFSWFYLAVAPSRPACRAIPTGLAWEVPCSSAPRRSRR